MADYSDAIPSRPGYYVYRFWSADGRCLYVGLCGERGPRRVSNRLGDHKRLRPWWPEVARTDVASFASTDQIIAEERSQVTLLEPVYNRALRGKCQRGHDLTGYMAMSAEGRCRKCMNVSKAKYDLSVRLRRYSAAGQEALW